MNLYSELYIIGANIGHNPSIADISVNTLAISTTGNIFDINDLMSGPERPLNRDTEAPEK